MAKVEKEELRLYLTNAHLKGFKSIEDVKIDFKKGLNILIGKNAAGKSNFLECLCQSFESGTSYRYANLKFISQDNDSFVWEAEKELNFTKQHPSLTENKINVREFLYINDKKVFGDIKNGSTLTVIEYKNRKISSGLGGPRIILAKIGFNVSPLYIKFNLPSELTSIDTPGKIDIRFEDNFEYWTEFNTTKFVSDILWDIESFYLQNPIKYKSLNKTTFRERLTISSSIKRNLKKYTPIQDIRFNENINIYKTDKLITIENIKLDFKVNNNWIPWSHLSDGSKRLFYLVSEITHQNGGLILVEEPELGIHPHQFHLIMEFLKEQSEEKQIIISTHSPQALNYLNEDELSHILITYYDNKKGTQLKHLTKAQEKKAIKYIKEVGFLSDYWMLSDLEQ
jgi:predicted ATP-dependent endonuclease of OLD family